MDWSLPKGESHLVLFLLMAQISKPGLHCHPMQRLDPPLARSQAPEKTLQPHTSVPLFSELRKPWGVWHSAGRGAGRLEDKSVQLPAHRGRLPRMCFAVLLSASEVGAAIWEWIEPFDEIIRSSIRGIIFDSGAQKPSGPLNINLRFTAGYFIYFKIAC